LCRLLTRPRGRGSGELGEMRAQYEVAARYPTAYYGQLARAKLGIDEIALRPPPQSVNVDASEALHAADILYAIGERDLDLHFVADLAEESNDSALIAGLGELTARYHDARAMLMIGKTALARGFPLDQYAFPDIGVPSYNPIGPEVDRCIVYSIARTESGFDQHDRSSANAVGLMQVTPEAGRDTAKRFGVAYNWDRLVSDPVYNTQMGAAEVAALLKEYRGSYIMTFAGYKCRARPGSAMGSAARRPARSWGRCGRLGRAHPLRRDPQLCAACNGECSGLPRAL
jgi:soluble lytic murein transglycosylase